MLINFFPIFRFLRKRNHHYFSLKLHFVTFGSFGHQNRAECRYLFLCVTIMAELGIIIRRNNHKTHKYIISI